MKLHKKTHEEGDHQQGVATKTFDITLVKEQLKYTAEKICLDKSNIFNELLSCKFSVYLEQGFPEVFLKKLQEEMTINVKTKNKEKYYASFYTHIVNDPEEKFKLENTPMKYMRVLLMKLCDALWHNGLKLSSKDLSDSTAVTSQGISDKEIESLQYLGGYVLHKLHSRLKRSKDSSSPGSQQGMSLLEAGRGQYAVGSFLDELNRGGLWQISPTSQKLFLLTEKYFRIKVSDNKKQRKINIEPLVFDLMKFSYIQDFLKEMCTQSDIPISAEIGQQVLKSVLTLYLQVRAFSFARDVVAKFRISKAKTGEKGLRKSLKRDSEESKNG